MDNPRSKSSSTRKPEPTRSWEAVFVRFGGWALGLFMTLLLVGIFFGNHFHGFLDNIGLGWLYNPESGVYADCSREANRNNPYCKSKKGGDQGWRDLKDNKGSHPGFSLH